jgi:hypothetical protein
MVNFHSREGACDTLYSILYRAKPVQAYQSDRVTRYDRSRTKPDAPYAKLGGRRHLGLVLPRLLWPDSIRHQCIRRCKVQALTYVAQAEPTSRLGVRYPKLAREESRTQEFLG